MIPLQEFVDLLRKRLDEELGAVASAVLHGQALDQDSAEATALAYSGAVGRMNGLRRAREWVDEIVKQANAGEL